MVILFIGHFRVSASNNNPSVDSLNLKNSQPRDSVTWGLTALLHSESLYFFTGGVDQYDPSTDLIFVFDKGGWGGLIYKSLDLINHNTGINYAMIVLHKHFYLGNNLLVTPNIGVNLNQNYSVADKGSDLMGDLAIAYKFGEHFVISNDAIFQNICITKDYNWTNRVKLLFKGADFDASALVWDRNRLFNNPGYLSAGADINYTGVKITSKTNLHLEASYIYTLQSDTHRVNGFMVSLGLDFGN